MLENIIREELHNVIKEQESDKLMDAIAKYNSALGQKLIAVAKDAIMVQKKTENALKDKDFKKLIELFQTAKVLYKELLGDPSASEKLEQAIKTLGPSALKGKEGEESGVPSRDFQVNKAKVMMGLERLAKRASREGNDRGFDTFLKYFEEIDAMTSQSELDKSGYMQFAEYADKEPNQ